MVQQAPRLERHLIAPQLSRNQAKAIVGLAAFFCFANSFDGDFVFDDSEAIVNNKGNELLRRGFLTRMGLLTMGGSSLLYMRWRIMGTGPPAFTEVDNPASFSDKILVRTVNYNYYYSLNAWLLLCPWWLCFDWSMGCIPLIESVIDWRIISVVVLWICLIGLGNQALNSGDNSTRRYIEHYWSGYGKLHFKDCVTQQRLLCTSLLCLFGLNMIRCIIRSSEWRSEEQLFRSALAVCPLNAKVHYNVGKNLADRGNQTSAIKYYREAIRLNPKYVHAMNNLGNILKERNELSEAEELLSTAVNIQPDFAAAWMNLGIVQNSLKKFQAAEQSYWNAIKYRKKYPDCYYNLGRLYADLNRHVDALNAWRNATMLKPNHSLAWNNMVILLDNTDNSNEEDNDDGTDTVSSDKETKIDDDHRDREMELCSGDSDSEEKDDDNRSTSDEESAEMMLRDGRIKQ
ncbi:TMTC4 protein, partial [Polypterus senegalus]